MSRKQAAVLLMAVLVLAAILRLYKLGDQNFWLDETYSLISSAGHYDEFAALPCNEIIKDLPNLTAIGTQSSVSGIWRSQLHDVHPPFYFLMLSYVRDLVGDTEFVVRLPSMIASIITLALLYVLCRSFSSRWASIFGVLVCTTAFSSISLAQEARPYSLALCFSVATAVVLTRIERRTNTANQPAGIGFHILYVFVATAALLTDHRALILVPVRLAFAWMAMRGTARIRIFLSEITAIAIYAAVFGGWFLVNQPWKSDVNWLTEQGDQHLVDTAIRLIGVPVRLIFGVEWTKSAFLQVFGGIVILCVAFMTLYKQSNRRPWLFVLWYAIPILFLCFVDLLQSSGTLGHTRFLLIALPGLAGLFALSWDALPKLAYRIVASVVITGCLLTFAYPTRVNPEAGNAAMFMDANVDSGTLIVMDGRVAPTWWAKTLLGRIAHYYDGKIDKLILLRDPVDQKAFADVGQFGPLIVLRGKVDSINPSLYPGYALQKSSSPFRGIGVIHLLRRETVTNTTTAPRSGQPSAAPSGRSSPD